MCIAVLSTVHPAYALVMISNRDEFLHRPTDPASWWPESTPPILAGRDLFRPEHGTWLGMTKTGRIAVLTNFSEQDQPRTAVSRGAMVNSFLQDHSSNSMDTDNFVHTLLLGNAVRRAGGFSLICGKVGEPLAVVSNRSVRLDDVKWVLTEMDQTVAVSNVSFGDRSWPKVVAGEDSLEQTLRESIALEETEDELVTRLLETLSKDTMPKTHCIHDFRSMVDELKESVFISPINVHDASDHLTSATTPLHHTNEPYQGTGNASGDKSNVFSGLYGTKEQTVILVDHSGRVKYLERTLFDDNANPIPPSVRDRTFVFKIESEEVITEQPKL